MKHKIIFRITRAADGYVLTDNAIDRFKFLISYKTPRRSGVFSLKNRKLDFSVELDIDEPITLEIQKAFDIEENVDLHMAQKIIVKKGNIYNGIIVALMI